MTAPAAPALRIPNYRVVRDRLESALADLTDAVSRRQVGAHDSATAFDGCVREALRQALSAMEAGR